MFKIIIYTIVFFSFLQIKGQFNSFFNNRVIEARFHYGFLWPHHSSIEYNVNGHVPAFELNLLYQANSKNIWEDLFRNPRKGMGISYFYLQDHDVFGSSIGMYGLFDIPIIRHKRFTSTYRICGGLSWLTRIWDIDDNYMHTAIGTHINLYFRFAFTGRFTIANNKELTLDAGLTHFSNGNIKEPNLGLNIVSSTIGFIYKFNTSEPIVTKNSELPELKKIDVNLYYSGGIKAVDDFNNHYYFKSGFKIHTGYNLNNKRQLGIGVDLFYDGTRKEVWMEEEVIEKYNKELIQAAILLFHDLRYQKLILTIQAGYYIYHRYDYIAIYNRIGLKYKLNKNYCVTVCLKSHMTQADYVEWGIGYTL